MSKSVRIRARRPMFDPRAHRRFPLRDVADLSKFPPLPPRFSCACGKIGYPDREAAELTLAGMDRGNSRRREVRTYRCHLSQNWHLTSQSCRYERG